MPPLPLQIPIMETSSALLYSKVTPFSFALSGNNSISSFRPFYKHLVGNNSTSSFRPFNKHLDGNLSVRNSLKNVKFPLHSTSSSNYLSIHNLPSKGIGSRFSALEFSSSSRTAASIDDSENPLLKTLKTVSWDNIKSAVLKLTPVDVCKWSFVSAVGIAASRWAMNVMFSPFFWMYFSWTWLFWPWIVAIGVAVYGVFCLKKHLRGDANAFEQLAIVTAAFTWLTLVPPAHFNGFLEGWPFVFFFVYHYFFFFNISVRKRMYGDYYPREHDPKWDITVPNLHTLLFCVAVMIGHWLAAFEGPELHLIPGGWSNLSIWVLIMLTLFMQYHSTLYLAKYSEKVVVPTTVVQFGPYRFVRHPIYASTMLLFVTYFAALRAPLSALFITVVCLIYYGQKARVEEALMVETFGEEYTKYMGKVRSKFIPFVY